jgi:hypothetical protein
LRGGNCGDNGKERDKQYLGFHGVYVSKVTREGGSWVGSWRWLEGVPPPMYLSKSAQVTENKERRKEKERKER